MTSRCHPSSKPSSVQMKHYLKTWPCYFEETLNGFKRFEVRKNDRGFKIGDLVQLQEWDPDYREAIELTGEGIFDIVGRYTGRILERRIIYITDFAQRDGWVVMSLGES